MVFHVIVTFCQIKQIEIILSYLLIEAAYYLLIAILSVTTTELYLIYLETALSNKCRSKKTWRIWMLLAVDWPLKYYIA